ncbi:MAG: hypothetical protein DI531_00815 [Brevundimonas sp.]|uniref:helix-turn-helix domain-containing protein n=1 Tax=Brevundimonas sp. TaxID=1871086 RepID=UPI000DB01C39|nr:helix-turn-helix transcriptional regulator [Brevundimonas sp.]PZU77357.1 MAG: hypothetical protein DI531_00815 [Brevundimonas sp.]
MTLGDTSVLDRLNGAERDVLVLLAQGHTAKSIASLRSVTVAAVNERLRSARRKTGVGSSRELARLVGAQDNRHDLIGLADTRLGPETPSRPDAPSLGRAFLTRRWRLIVITATLLATGLLAYQAATPPAPQLQTPRSNSLVEEILAATSSPPDIAALHAEASAHSNDETWSSATEQLLKSRHEALPDFGMDVETLNITCATTLCEVVGKARSDLAGEKLDRLMAAIQGLDRSEPRLPLKALVHHFNATNGSRPNAVFVSYWHRED